MLQTATTANLGLMPGYYLFTGLCANTYMVEVDDSASPPLAGLTPTLTYQGGDPAKDSNQNPETVTLPANDSSDLTIDFGYV